MGDLDARLLTIVTDAPGGSTLYVYHEFRKGALATMESSTTGKFAERSVDVRISGSYDTFARLQKGTLTLQAAYLQRLIRLGGDVQRALQFAAAFVKYYDLVRAVETEF